MSTLIVSSIGRCRRFVIIALLIGSTAFAAPLAAADIMITSGSLDMRPSAGTVILEGDRGFSSPLSKSQESQSRERLAAVPTGLPKRFLGLSKLAAQQCCRRQSLLCWNISCTSDHDVRLFTLVVTRLRPDADAFGAVSDRSVDVEILQMQLLIADDDVDVVLTTQAVVSHR